MISKARVVMGIAVVLLAAGILFAAQETKSETTSDAGLSSAAAKSAQSTADDNDKRLSAILFVNSKSCQCTREKCEAAEVIMEGVKKEFTEDISYETIDYELQYEKAMPLLQRYKIFMIPTLVITDKEDHVLWRCMDFSKADPIHSKFKQLLTEEPAVKSGN